MLEQGWCASVQIIPAKLVEGEVRQIVATFKHLYLNINICVCMRVRETHTQSTRYVFYVTTIVYHLLHLLHHACGWSSEWSVTINELRGNRN